MSVKILKEDERIFDVELDFGNMEKETFKDLKRIKIRMNGKYYRFNMDYDGGLVVNKQDDDDTAITIMPCYSNEIKLN